MAPLALMSSPKLGAGSIASRWRELRGSKSWEGLLKPLDADLRASIIAYGELAEAAYDGFNDDENTKDAGACLYSPTGLLAASGVSHPEYYTVTKFLYATSDLVDEPFSELPGFNAFFVRPAAHLRDGPWWRRTNWIGYVAVATDEGAAALGRREIVVAWRGTVEKLEMFKDIVFASVPAAAVVGSAYGKSAHVHAGFLSVYTAKQETSPDDKELKISAGEQALEELRRLLEVHKEEETSITVTGHSLGAALATLNAVDIVAHGVNASSSGQQRRCPVTAIVFACPQVGTGDFKDAMASFPDLRVLHVKNAVDMVPMVPTHDFAYVDTATATLDIDTDRSTYLRPRSWWPFVIDDLLRSHNLECYLHAIAGDHGAGNEFKLVVDRDLALVNKGTDSLKDDYPVPTNWWGHNSKYEVKGIVARFKLDYFNEG